MTSHLFICFSPSKIVLTFHLLCCSLFPVDLCLFILLVELRRDQRLMYVYSAMFNWKLAVIFLIDQNELYTKSFQALLTILK